MYSTPVGLEKLIYIAAGSGSARVFKELYDPRKIGNVEQFGGTIILGRNMDIIKFVIDGRPGDGLVRQTLLKDLTCLTHAADCGNWEALVYLLEHPLKSGYPNINEYAIILRKVTSLDMARKIVSTIPDMDKVGIIVIGMFKMKRHTILHGTCASGNLHAVTALVERGALSSRDDSGDTPFLVACQGMSHGHTEIAKFFLDAGTGVDERSESPARKTGLAYAIEAHNPQLVRLLRDRGADISLVDEYTTTEEESSDEEEGFPLLFAEEEPDDEKEMSE